jgi:hypothetical protein
MIGGLFRRRSGGESTLTIPPLDGAFLPNSVIETSLIRTHCAAPDNLVDVSGEVQFSSGARRYRIDADGNALEIESLPSDITAMAADAHGRLAIAYGKEIRVVDRGRDAYRVDNLDGGWPGDVTALCFADARTLLICVGSETSGIHEWSRDLLEHGRSGSVWKYDLDRGTATCLARRLAYPWGVAPARDGLLLVAEAWEYRIARIEREGAVTTVLGNLPGYPARIIRRTRGGYWLAIAAPRNQLVEFILGETQYRRTMLETVSPADWIAPSLSPPTSFLQPMQQGAQRILGAVKPWSPSFSYGLVVQLDDDAQPVASFHSRADGSRHGILSLVELGNSLLVSSFGGNAVIEISAH